MLHHWRGIPSMKDILSVGALTEPFAIGLWGMKTRRLKSQMLMIVIQKITTVSGILHGILLDIFFAVVAMITTPSFGAEIGLEIIPEMSLRRTKAIMNKVLATACLIISSHLRHCQHLFLG